MKVTAGPHALRLGFVRLMTLLALGFVLVLIWRERVELLGWLAAIDVPWAASSLVLLFVSNASAALLFAALAARRSATRVPVRLGAGAFLLGQVGKYLPGRIWGVAQQAALLAGRLRVGAVVVANLEVFGVVLLLTSGLGMALLAFDAAHHGLAAAALAATLVLAAAALRSRLLDLLLGRVWRVLPARIQHAFRGSEGERSGQAPRHGLAFAACLAFCTAFVSGWFLLFNQGLGLGAAESVRITAILAVSAVVGMLSLLPGGLGAREAAMVVLGGSLASEPASMASLAVVTRAAIIVVDLLSAITGAAMLGTSQVTRAGDE